LYHWTHLELQRYFNIHDILNGNSAKSIYDNASAQISKPEYSVRGLLKKMNVKVVCTTDDPLDDLKFHQSFKKENTTLKMYPAWRPDAAMNVDSKDKFNAYVEKLNAVNGGAINNFSDYLDALKKRHDYFAAHDCTLSDHGLEEIYADDYTDYEIINIFAKIRSGKDLELVEVRKFKSAMLYHFAIWDAEKGWVQQFHLGALRNNNSRMLSQLGPDTGWDSIRLF
jgi:glucuronate isomerase